MNLKKFFSIILAISLSSAMITLPVKADLELSWWHMDEASLVDSEKPNKSKVVNALGGKESGTVYYFETNTNSSNALAESYIRLNASAYSATGSFDDASKCLVYPKTNGYNSDASQTMQSYEGYMIISLNMYPTSNSQRFIVTRRGGGSVTGTITTAESNHFVVNKWNKVDIFVRLSASADNRKSTTYVNGQFVYTHNSHSLFSLSSGQDEDLRFGVPKEDGRAGYYIDDMYVAFTTQTPATDNIETVFSSVLEMPALSGISGRAEVSGSTLTMLDDVTVSELDNANTNTVTAFEDSAFTTELSQNTVLDNGNIVVVTDSKGKMSYYSVLVEEEDILWTLDVSKVKRYEKASGLAGKAADDISMQYPETSGDRYMQLDYAGWYTDSSCALKPPAVDMTGYNGYMIISYNVMAPNETNSVGITTDQGTVVAGNSAGGAVSMTSKNGFVKGRWNRVVHIISLASGVSSADTYVNGVLRGTRESNLYSSGKTAIRISARDSGLIYFDDVKVQFTQSAPDMTSILKMPKPKNIQAGTVSENRFVVSGNILVSAVTSDDGEVAVFKNSALKDKLAQSDYLKYGNVIVVLSQDGAIGYYSVNSKIKEHAAQIKDNSGNVLRGFKQGIMTFEKDCYADDDEDIMVAIAQYDDFDDTLIHCDVQSVSASGETTVSVPYTVQDVDNTTIKFMIWDKETMRPISALNEFSPFVPYSTINATDTQGDYCFFDNRYCYVAHEPSYSNFSASPKTNEIVLSRLINYQSADRTNYIYMNRTTSDDCYFDIKPTIIQSTHNADKVYKYYKFEGDFKISKLGSIIQLPMIRDNKSSSTSATSYPCQISSSGWFNFSDGTASSVKVTQGSEFHYLMFINLETHKCDVYVSGSFGNITKKSIPIDTNIKQINIVRVSLTSGNPGSLYADNLNFTGLDKPIVNGVETKTAVFSDDTEVKAFLSGKTAVHAYGNILYKNGVKSQLAPGIYIKDEEEYYVPASSLASILGISETFADGEINGYANISSSGTVTINGEYIRTLDVREENGQLYVPLRKFARKIMRKYVWFYKTGIIIISDNAFDIDTTDWKYQSERIVEQTTVWNDIDFLNNYLQYVRPDKTKLRADYVALTGDTSLTQHPRLIINSNEFAEIRQHYENGDDQIFNELARLIIAKADSYIDAEPIGYKWDDSMRTLNTARALVEKFIYLGYAYQLTGNTKYVQEAVKQFEKCDSYPDFNPAHIIDTGEYCFAFAIGFDWFYNAFTPAQRTVAKRVTHDKALTSLASGLYGRLSSSSSGTTRWLAYKWMSNYNAIINGGVIAASIATFEYDTNETLEYIANSLRSIEYSLQMLTPDGGWNEALSYWEYSMRYILSVSKSLNTCFGSTYNIMNGQGMENTLNYAISCLGTSGINNYGDSNVGKASTQYSCDTFYGLAKILNNPVATSMRNYDFVENGKYSYMDTILYDFDMAEESETVDVDSVMPKMLKIGGTEIVSIRDSYDKSKSQTYFSAHFGTTSGYHQHCDCGTFVLDLLGERWAEDLGRDSYNLQNELGYSSYQIFRNRAEAHNVLVLNPSAYSESYEMKSGEFASIIDAQCNATSGFVYANMDDVYNEASSMTLGYFIDENMGSLTVRNEFTLDCDVDAVWSMVTGATVTISGNTVYLYKNGKSLKLNFICSGEDAHWECVDAEPGENSPQCPEQAENTGYKKISLKFNANVGDNYFVVKISPNSIFAKPVWDIPINEWKLN